LNPAPTARQTANTPLATQAELTILGIETSCDETGVALVRLGQDNRGQILGQALHSQIDLHAAYGGVVPELASRDHILKLLPLTQQVFGDAQLGWDQVDAIAYTEGPGLAGALLVGASVAQGLAAATGKPVMGIHHLEGHLLSPLLQETESVQPALAFPFLALLVSGGHTQIMEVSGIGQYRLLGETIDDAAGEAFDKSAQLLGLGYPGGPEIGRWAEKGKATRFELPRPLIRRPTLDFSFAGLKTAVLTQVQKLVAAQALDDQARADMAASVQSAIVDVLVNKCQRAMDDTGISTLVIAGGVGANRELRRQLSALEQKRNATIVFPPPSLCTDNGVMIAWAAALRLRERYPAAQAGAFSVQPRWPLENICRTDV
jgi:N6-L-threonylcarbamoyladenine synthase